MAFDSIILILQTLGPFTVLVTVYFLVTELKEQNKVARANARQNVSDSHQEIALKGMTPRMVKIKMKLRNNEELTPEEDAAYLTYFSIMLRSRENQHYQYSIGMIDAGEWDNYLKSFKTLFKSEYHLKLWNFMKETFNEDFVKIVEGIINENN